MKAKMMIGSLSYLKPGMQFRNERIAFHKNQLEMWERFDRVPFYQVEIFWDDEAKSALQTSLDLHSIEVQETCYAGAARNKLLKVLYSSDFDYLICCDDDCLFRPEVECFDFLRQLTPELAAKQSLICFSLDTFLDKNQKAARLNDRSTIEGYVLYPSVLTYGMQMCCIPNLVKYGKEPIWQHEDDPADVEVPPEDSIFLVDWVARKYPVYDTRIIFCHAQDRFLKSSIYESRANRVATSPARTQKLCQYIKEKFPNRPDIKDLYSVSRKKNSATIKRLSCTVPREQIRFD